VRRFLGATGRVLITGGVLVLLFVAYQLWGTGIYEARAQNRLKDEFQEQLRQSRATTTTAPTTTTGPAPTEPPPTVPTTEPAPAAPIVANGDSVGIIDIPKIGLSKAFVEGVNVDDLRNGPGHYPGTPFPGQVGNAAVAGHRTTYGAPFENLDQLVEGDEIRVQTLQGEFRYKVSERGPYVVDPDDSSPLDEAPNAATLTLTTCDPKYSAAQRLIVKANLVLPAGEVPLPATVEPDAPEPEISGLSGESSSRAPAILWGAIAAVVGMLWWLMFHRHPRWSTWLVGAIPFVAALFVFYTYLERVLPSNY
jgi:sortase A